MIERQCKDILRRCKDFDVKNIAHLCLVMHVDVAMIYMKHLQVSVLLQLCSILPSIHNLHESKHVIPWSLVAGTHMLQ